MKDVIGQIKNNKIMVILSCVLGLFAYFLSRITDSGLADPLVIALVIGIAWGYFSSKKEDKKGFSFLPFVFIPFGAIFYAIKNLNIIKISEVDNRMLLLLLAVVLTYYLVTIFFGKIFKQKRAITYLTATGGAICGASAITITAPAVEADSDDVSISLISVLIAAIFALFVLLPFLAVFFEMSNEIYALLSGSVLQFTGFVKAAIGTMPPLTETMSQEKVMSFALSVKATRYLGLLIAIPLFASFIKGKFSLPWYLWAFVIAGLLGSFIYRYDPGFYNDLLIPIVKPVYNIIWSIAMVAIGFTADMKRLFSNAGLKALAMSFIGFFAAILVFVLGLNVFNIV